MVALPHKPICFPKSKLSPFWARDASDSRPLGGVKSGQTLGKYSAIV